ncbi:MAG: hypothetical protein EA397_06770 [Deltaproteobacteria bacterium]|nr:MAG: hypothetical protein EA397_06770 [Deltaproteobacteria bacterium]
MHSSSTIRHLTLGGAAFGFALALAPLLACGNVEVSELDEGPGAGATDLLDQAQEPSDPKPQASGWTETCGSDSPTVFTCGVPGGKEIAVCGSLDDDTPWMRYRFGTPVEPDLLFPEDPEGSLNKFTVEQRSYVRSQGDVLRFDHDGKTYEIAEMAGGGGGPDAAENNFMGLRILQGDDVVSSVACEGEPISDWSTVRNILEPVSP